MIPAGNRLPLSSLVCALALALVSTACGSGDALVGSVRVSLSPQTATVVTGQTQAFAAAVAGSNERRVLWSVEEGTAAGSITSDGVYTAPSKPGTYTVVATSVADESATARATVTVIPVGTGGDSVRLNPSSVTLGAGQTQQFTATAPFDAGVNWSVQEGSAGGQVTSGGFYTAPSQPGTYHVVATSKADASLSAVATVTVVPVTVAVSPNPVLVEVGQAQPFTATVTGSDNTGVVWTVKEGMAGGSITAQGLYTAPASPGVYNVLATSVADATRSASALVNVINVVTVSVSPSPVTLSTSQQQQFTATVAGSTNTQVTWTSTGGNVSATGLYTAPATPGSYQVTATSVANPAKKATVTITVIQGISVAVNPTSVTLQAGQTQTFSATVGGTANTGVNWSVQEGASGGTITAAGLYTAPNNIGTYHVVATSKADGSRSAVATVTVVGKPVTLSGTVTYAGAKTGRIYLAVGNDTYDLGIAGTSIASKGAFTIRGFAQPGTFLLRAFMDTTNTGLLHRTVDPRGQLEITVGGTNLTGLNVTLTDPQPDLAPGKPGLSWVAPADKAVVLRYEPSTNFVGDEDADAYRIYWSDTNTTPVGPNNHIGSRVVKANSSRIAVVDFGLANGTAYYFAVSGVDNGYAGSPSNTVGPVTVGAPAAGSTLSGQVLFTGIAPQGALYVIAESGTRAYATRIAAPASPQSIQLTGVANGTYYVTAFLDQDGQGEVGPVDLGNWDAPQKVNVTGSTGLQNITFSPDGGTTFLSTEHHAGTSNDSYALNLYVWPNAKRPVKVALKSGPKVVVPLDLALYEWNWGLHYARIALGSTAPVVGDSYAFDVTYSDGTTGTLSVAVDAVLAAPNLLSPVSTGTTQPTFTWSAPNPAPATPYTYGVELFNFIGQLRGEAWGIPSTQTSIGYAGLNPSGPLSGGIYDWTLTVTDSAGNVATRSASFVTE